MARQARGEYLNPLEVQTAHLVQRCVRRAWLCGADPVTGQSFEHRREWIRARLEFLASVFGVDCLTYTVLSNHLHLVLRSRPDVVQTWSDEDVARRWWQLFPQRRAADGSAEQPAKDEIAAIVDDAKRLAELRRRLSDISWWMRCTAENIARRANREDEVTGRFWEGRFKAQLLLDETSLLACAAYVDLNPVRAAMATTPEESTFTGAKDRIDDLKAATTSRATKTSAPSSGAGTGAEAKSGWLSPLEIDERRDSVGPDAEVNGRRASRKGFPSMSLEKYLELLDWTGRQLRSGKRGSIPEELAPILTRLGLCGDHWCDLVQRFGKLFKRAAGTAVSLAQEAQRRGQRYLHAPGLTLFSAAD